MKLAFVTPRYGADVTSSPEHACRLFAEHLSARHEIDVLTTCAHDPRTWRNEFPEGPDRVRGVLVRRFAAAQTRDPGSARELSLRLRSMPRTRDDELEWVRRVGPESPALMDYLRRQHRSYDALVFFGLLSPTTVFGVQIAPEHSVVFPCLHLRPELRFGLWKEVLEAPRAVAFVSNAEPRLMHQYVAAHAAHEELVGIGIDPAMAPSYPRHQRDQPDALAADDAWPAPSGPADEREEYLERRGVLFRRRHRLYGDFVLYGGRFEPDNGCEEMLEYFDAFAQREGEIPLVLMGVKMMKIPDVGYVRLAGVLPDRERATACEAATVTIAPAPDDLLSQPLLESFAVGTPVLANAANPAAVEHCRAAGAGLYYGTRDEFVEALRLMLTDDRLRQRLGENGRAYVKHHFRWDAVVGRFERVVAHAKSTP